MPERIQRRRTSQLSEQTAEQAETSRQSVDYDALLDEIDQVLESDAEEYVRSFVQKGGQ